MHLYNNVETILIIVSNSAGSGGITMACQPWLWTKLDNSAGLICVLRWDQQSNKPRQAASHVYLVYPFHLHWVLRWFHIRTLGWVLGCRSSTHDRNVSGDTSALNFFYHRFLVEEEAPLFNISFCFFVPQCMEQFFMIWVFILKQLCWNSPCVLLALCCRKIRISIYIQFYLCESTLTCVWLDNNSYRSWVLSIGSYLEEDQVFIFL